MPISSSFALKLVWRGRLEHHKAVFFAICCVVEIKYRVRAQRVELFPEEEGDERDEEQSAQR